MTTTSKAAATAEAPKTESVAKGKGATKAKGNPRPRKWDYGIKPDAVITRAPLEKDEKGNAKQPNVKADIKADWERTNGNPTCEAYTANGGSRHGLRVMARRKLITIVHKDGSVYPKEYVAPAPKAKKAPAEKAPAKPKAVK